MRRPLLHPLRIHMLRMHDPLYLAQQTPYAGHVDLTKEDDCYLSIRPSSASAPVLWSIHITEDGTPLLQRVFDHE